MEKKSFGLAFIGAGSVVEYRHLPGLNATGQGDARCIFDPDSAKAAAVADQFRIARVAASLEEAVTGDDIDAVVIASPNSFHREGVERAVEAGKHVFCEKPIALNLGDARAMCEAAGRAGLVLFLGFHHRFSAEHLCMRRVLEEGLVGDVRAFNSVISEPIDVVPGGQANYRFRPEQGGGLTLIDVGSHRIDQIRDLLGEVEEVFAELGSVLPYHELDDSIVLSMRMKSGALGSLNFHRFSRAFLSPCTLFGTAGTASMSSFIVNPLQSAPVSLFLELSPADLPADLQAWRRPERWWSEGDPGWINFWPPRLNTFEYQYEEFFSAIREKRMPTPGGEDGYKALEIVLAAHLSFQQRRPVRLPLDPDAEIPQPRFS